MKRKILVPMFASMMALSMNTIANADEVNNTSENKDKQNTLDDALNTGEYKESTYKKAVVKDGVALKVREQGSVQHVAYTGDEFKVVGVQGEWVKVNLGESEGWLASRYVDITEATGYTTGDKINFRKEANTDSEIIEELEIGSAVTVLEDNGDWLKVKKGENEGYIRGLYVSEEAPVIEVEEEVVEEAVVASAQQNSNNSQTTNNSQSSNNTRPSSNSSNNGGQTQKPAEKPAQNESYNPPASNTSTAQAVVNLAYAKIGSPYVWGAEGPNSFDCSGFTSYVMRNAAGVSIPRTSSAQSGYGQTVSRDNLQPGDLVFFNTSGSGVSHVGIYVGGGNMVHSPSSGKSVSVASINSSYYSSRFVTAKRVF